MRYEDARRLCGVEGVWLSLKLWLRPRPARLRTGPIIGDLRHLSDHERRDIGLPEPVRYMDWHRLNDDSV
jgi:hypothetical protein